MKKIFLLAFVIVCCGCYSPQKQARTTTHHPTLSEAQQEEADWKKSQDRFENDLLEISGDNY